MKKTTIPIIIAILTIAIFTNITSTEARIVVKKKTNSIKIHQLRVLEQEPITITPTLTKKSLPVSTIIFTHEDEQEINLIQGECGTTFLQPNGDKEITVSQSPECNPFN